MRLSSAAVLCLFLLSQALVFGQTGLATLTGSVTDPSGAVIPNVAVNARRIDT
jgi:hypothetical protein